VWVDPQAQPDAQGWGVSVITSGEIQKSRTLPGNLLEMMNGSSPRCARSTGVGRSHGPIAATPREAESRRTCMPGRARTLLTVCRAQWHWLDRLTRSSTTSPCGVQVNGRRCQVESNDTQATRHDRQLPVTQHPLAKTAHRPDVDVTRLTSPSVMAANPCQIGVQSKPSFPASDQKAW